MIAPSNDKYLYARLIRLHVLHHAVKEPIYRSRHDRRARTAWIQDQRRNALPDPARARRQGLSTSTEERIRSTARRVYRATPAGTDALAAAKQKVRELFKELFEDDEPPETPKQKRRRS